MINFRSPLRRMQRLVPAERLPTGGQGRWLAVVPGALLGLATVIGPWPACASETTVNFRITDTQGQRLPCSIFVRDAQGQPTAIKGHPFWYDHFACDGRASIRLPAGAYQYMVDRGPEYERAGGHLLLADQGRRTIQHQLDRIVTLRDQGWRSADLHIHRPAQHVKLLMKAADLDVGPVITWWNQRNELTQNATPRRIWEQFDEHRYYSATAGEDERQGGALLYFGMSSAIDITGGTSESPSPLRYVAEAREVEPNVWIDIEKPFWWDVPVWLASGQMNSIGLANNHMCRDQMLVDEAWGFPRDTERLPNPRGNGYWTQEIYYHVLNCGIRIPPSAGSASGVLPNPVGYNRVYVHVTGPWSIDAWWRGLRRGNCFVTNGPLLVCRAQGRLPGNVLQLEKRGEPVELDIELSGRDRVRQVEIVHNGQVVHQIPTVNARRQTIQTQFVPQHSGWFLIRGIADDPRTFRFASTGPFYLQLGQQPSMISERSVRFFLEWVGQRTRHANQALRGDDQIQDVLRHHSRARQFWRQRLARSNAE